MGDKFLDRRGCRQDRWWFCCGSCSGFLRNGCWRGFLLVVFSMGFSWWFLQWLLFCGFVFFFFEKFLWLLLVVGLVVFLMGFGGWHGGGVVVATVIMVVVASRCCGGFAWWWLVFFPWCRGGLVVVVWVVGNLVVVWVIGWIRVL